MASAVPGGPTVVPEPLMLWHPVHRAYSDRLGALLVKNGAVESAEAWSRIKDEAARVLAQCLPAEAPCGRRTGVAIAYAQSSEMMSMTSVAALARDNGFRVVITITGAGEDAFERARDRFQHDLAVDAPPPFAWVAWTNPTPHRDQESLGKLVRQWTDARIEDDQQAALFMSVLRHPVRLDQLARLLESQDLAGVNVLVLDDECDSAGPAAHPLAPEPGAIHGSIRRIRDCLPKHTYVQYTSSAQGPFAISLLDMLSPDFVDVLEAGGDFCGGQAFFVERSDLVHVIPEDERPDAIASSPDPPGSLLRALRLFLVGVAAQMAKKVGEHRSMLVHPQHRSEIHRAYRTWIDRTLRTWGSLLALPPGNRDRQLLAAEFEQARKELSVSAGPLPPLEELLISLSLEVPRTRVTEVESATGEEILWGESSTHVLIGGQRLEGGHALRGLTVTYMPKGRGASMLDMIEQRARFFGAKRAYLGFCRVFLQHDLARVYQEHAQQEARVREHVVAHRGRATRDLRRTLILDARCQPSQKAIATQPFFRTQTRGWFKQKMPHVASALELNVRRVETFLHARRTTRHARYSHKCAAARLKEVIELLGKYAFGPEELLEAQIFIEQLMKLAESNPDMPVAVYLMQPEPRFRTTRGETDDTIELHEPRPEDDVGGYPGDAVLRDVSKITLQIHWLRVSRLHDGEEILAAARVPALAIHIPQAL
jgi:hypothetical protein